MTADQAKLLALAVKNNDIHVIKYLVENQGFELSLPMDNEATLLMLAAGYGNMDMVKYLIDNGVDVFLMIW